MDLTYNPESPSGCAVVLCAQYARLLASGAVKLTKATSTSLPEKPTLSEPIVIIQFLLTKAAKTVAEQLTCSKEPEHAADIDRWMSFVAERDFTCTDATSLHVLNSHLLPRTFFVSTHITLADLVLFAALHAWAASSSVGERAANPCLVRWFDHIQHLPGIFEEDGNPFPLVELTMEQKKHSKKTDGQQMTKGEKTQQNASKSPQKTKPVAKDETKKPPQAPTVPETSQRPLEDPTRLEIRVGKVVRAWNHPEAERLYCEEVDIGEQKLRNVASGLREHIPIEQFQGQKVLLLANMKEKKLRGFGSHGMILCGKCDLGNGTERVELVLPPEDAKIGELVTFEGLRGDPDPVMNTKTGKDPFVVVQPGFRVDENGIASWKVPSTTTVSVSYHTEGRN